MEALKGSALDASLRVLDLPIHPPDIKLAFVQILAIVVAVYSQTDVFVAISTFIVYNPTKREGSIT